MYRVGLFREIMFLLNESTRINLFVFFVLLHQLCCKNNNYIMEFTKGYIVLCVMLHNINYWHFGNLIKVYEVRAVRDGNI